MKKKLERQLLAAGIKIDKHYNESTQETYNVIRNGSRYLILDQHPAPTFKECKEFLKFEGHYTDGLEKRLDNSRGWVKDEWYTFSNEYSTRSLWMDTLDCEISTGVFGVLVFEPHQIWKFLDKIDAAKAKGGKQTVKFKGDEYEFDFPNVIIEECSEHTEEQLKELIPATIEGERKRLIEINDVLRVMTKQEKERKIGKGLINERRLLAEAFNKQVEEIDKDKPKEPAWKSVTGWDSIKDCSGNTWQNLSNSGNIGYIRKVTWVSPTSFATEKQAQQILAFSQLTQIHKAMMEGSDDVKKDIDHRGYLWLKTIRLDIGRYMVDEFLCQDLSTKPDCNTFDIKFYTEEQRDHFIKHNEDLINQYIGL